MQSCGGGSGYKLARGLGDGRLYLCSASYPAMQVNAHSQPQYVHLPGVGAAPKGHDAGRGDADSGTAASHAQPATGGQGIAPRVTSATNPSATTLMVRNMPHRVTLKSFLAELDISGFAGAWDFLHFPTYDKSGSNKGYAFLNFHTSLTAKSFAEEWQGSQRFGMRGRSKISVTEAELQGFDANVSYWDRSDAHCSKPLIRRKRRTEASAPSSGAASSNGASPPTTTEGSQSFQAAAAQMQQEEKPPKAPPAWALPMPAFYRPVPQTDADHGRPSPKSPPGLHRARGNRHTAERKTIRRAFQ